MKVLFCVYTCKEDAGHLQAFKRSPLYKWVSDNEAFEVIEVYADGSLKEPTFENGILTLACDEAYPKLSVKTYEMVRYCLKHFDFDFLVKCDCTVLNVFDVNKLLKFVRSKKSYLYHYNGVASSKLTERVMRNWRKKKGLEEQIPRSFKVMYPGHSSFSFYAGKLYIVSRPFCRYIARYGKRLANKYVKYHHGTEDQMVGLLYQRFTLAG